MNCYVSLLVILLLKRPERKGYEFTVINKGRTHPRGQAEFTGVGEPRYAGWPGGHCLRVPKEQEGLCLNRIFQVGAHGRGCLKTDYFIGPPVGAVCEPPEIRALLEAPLQGIPSFLGF